MPNSDIAMLLRKYTAELLAEPAPSCPFYASRIENIATQMQQLADTIDPLPAGQVP